MKKIIFIKVIIFFVLSPVIGYAEYIRPPRPVMDYVPQNIGIYDTYYKNFLSGDCRVCHGNRYDGEEIGEMPYRHQYTALSFNPCPDGSPITENCFLKCHSTPGPTEPTSDCRECHAFYIYNISPHHISDFADSGQCTACHRPDLLSETYRVFPLSYYPTASTNTPKLINCENCHWPSGNFPHAPPPQTEWDLWTGFPLPSHPENATPTPAPIEANGPMYSGQLNYPTKQFQPMEGAHHEVAGKIYQKCYECHGIVHNVHSDDPVTMRLCQNCHDINTLHGIQEHMTDNNIYTIDGVSNQTVTAEQKCIACHGVLPGWEIPTVIKPPVIKGLAPMFGEVGTLCEINGENFGTVPGSILLTPRIGETDQTYEISSGSPYLISWDTENISFNIPSELSPRNYNIRVKTTDGISNIKVFTIKGEPVTIPCPTSAPSITKIEPPLGAENALVTIYGSDFGDRHADMRDVLLEDISQNPYPASIYSWTENMIKFRVQGWCYWPGDIKVIAKNRLGQSSVEVFELRRFPYISYIDPKTVLPTSSITISGKGFGDLQEYIRPDNYGWTSKIRLSRLDTLTGIEETITVTPDSWSDETITITIPDNIPADSYGLTVETKYFHDDNSSGSYDEDDTVYQRVITDPVLLNILPKGPHLIAPNGGEVIPSGSTYNIKWETTPETVKFDLLYSLNNGTTWNTIAKEVTGSSYDWRVPTPSKNKDGCLIKIIGYNASGMKVGEDTSDLTFKIEVVKLTSPNGGEKWDSGSTYAITWTSNGTKNPVANVKLLYTTNGGSTWKLITTRSGNPGNYPWEVPWVSKKKTKCMVKVVLKDESGKTVGIDVSDNYFTIRL